MSEAEPRPKRRRWERRLMWTAIAVVVVWVLGDFGYSTVIAYRYRAWEATIDRNEDGVRKGCEADTLGDGDTAILFVHGINDSPACYRDIGESLSEEGFRCRLMRMPGFGEPLEKYAASTREQWIQSVRDELAALREDHDRVYLVAHSLGGAVAIQILLESPDAADGAILLAPAVDVSSDRSPLFTTATWHRVANRLLVFTTATESPFGLDAKKANDKTYPYRHPFTPRRVFDETFALIESNRGRAAEFKTPLLMILSPDDVVIDVQAARDFFNDATAEPKQLTEIQDTGHSMTVDHQWQSIATEISQFIEQLKGMVLTSRSDRHQVGPGG